LFNKIFIYLIIFINLSLKLYADERQLIINRLQDISNITFDFEQKTNEKKEIGTCVLVFDNKLSCDYKDSFQKRILINDKTLVIHQKRYDKIYIYPISNSPFTKIFNKNSLVNLIKNSDYQLNNNIELTYLSKNKEKIKIFFEKGTYNLVGWRIVDQLQNTIYFSIKTKHINSEINHKIFRIPSLIKE
jgi:outer membrane lipoprotein-sorting protein